MKPDPTHLKRLGIVAAVLTLIAALMLPAAATAQDPAGDQYAPATPNGGGDYDFGATGDPAPTSAPDSGSGSTSDAGGGQVPVAPAEAANGTTTGGDAATGGNRDQRTVSQLGVEGEQDRAEGPVTASTAPRVSSDASTSAGLGTLLWVLLGATLLWAIVIGVVNFRRRGEQESGSGARSGANGSQPA